MPRYYTHDSERFYRKDTCDGSPTGHAVMLGGLTIVFSYDTVVAFAISGYGWVVCENVWSRTTGKHLNNLTPISASQRLPRDEFINRLDMLTAVLDGQGSLDDLCAVLRVRDEFGAPATLDTIDRLEAFIS